MNEKQLKEINNELAYLATLESVVEGAPKRSTINAMAMIEYIRFLKKKEAKLIKYIEDKATKNTVDGGTKILSASQIQHVLKTLKKDWKEADADADKTDDTDKHKRTSGERESSIVCA